MLISRVALFLSPRAHFFDIYRGLTSRRATTPRPSPERRGSPLPTPQAPASEISHVIRLLDTSTTATNVAIPTTGFQCLKDMRGNYVQDCWETVTLTSFSRSQSRGTACEIVGKPRHNDRRHRNPQHTAKPRPENRPRPHPNLAPEISHVIRLLDNSTTATNVAIPTSRFQCLKDMRGNYVRDCWETMTLTSFSRLQSRGTACEIVGKPQHNDRRHRGLPTHSEAATGKPATASSMDADQMRKGSFFTRPRPFHQVPSPSVSPAPVSGMRIRTSA